MLSELQVNLWHLKPDSLELLKLVSDAVEAKHLEPGPEFILLVSLGLIDVLS